MADYDALFWERIPVDARGSRLGGLRTAKGGHTE
jgi:hypothetical protein